MTTWLENAVSLLEAEDKKIADDVQLQERRKMLQAVRPPAYSDTSWGRKVWPKAMRQVLARYYKADSVIPEKHLSPLERMMRRAGHEPR